MSQVFIDVSSFLKNQPEVVWPANTD